MPFDDSFSYAIFNILKQVETKKFFFFAAIVFFLKIN